MSTIELELDDHHTRVIVQVAHEPLTLARASDSVVRFDDRRITEGIESFKDFSEDRAA